MDLLRPALPRSALRRVGLTLSLALLPATSPAADRIPIEDLFRQPLLRDVALAPGGARFAAITADGKGTENLLVFDLKANKPSGLRGDGKYDIYSMRWLDDDHLLYNVSSDKVYAHGLYVAHRDKLEDAIQINHDDVTRIVGVPRQRKNRVLVWIEKAAHRMGDPGDLMMFATDATTKQALVDESRSARIDQVVTPPRGNVLGWFTDQDGELAGCVSDAKGRIRLFWYTPREEHWRELPLDLDVVDPVCVDVDRRWLWVVTRDAKGYALRRYGVDTGTLEEPLLTDPEYDLGEAQLYFSPRTRKLAGVGYERTRWQAEWYDVAFATAHATLEKFYPGAANVLINCDTESQRFLFRSSAPDKPAVYVLVDLAAHSARVVGAAYPWLTAPLCPATTLSIKARDGLPLEALFTLPKGADAKHRVPMVVLVHGGPHARDSWEYDPEAQFLANRGWAVLQVNYRGSTGFSPALSHDAAFDFKRMHEDVTDATKALMTHPAVDPQRVAIMGASFGGYLAAAGVAFEPDLYRCAVSTCGVFDWSAMLKFRKRWGRPGEYARLTAKLGNPTDDRAAFEQISPLSHVAQVRVPVLIAHGNLDQVVDVAQSKRFASALKKQGVPTETFFRSTEGHGFYNDKNRIEYYRQVEAFLNRYLGEAKR